MTTDRWRLRGEAVSVPPVTVIAPARDAIGSVSLAQAAGDPQGFADALGRSLERYGFVVVSDHGIPAELIARAEAMAHDLFALPDAAKRAWHDPAGKGQRGYVPFGIEAAKGAHACDLKEFWHIGRGLPPSHRYAAFMPPNVWPEQIEGFRETFQALFAAFETAGLRILEAIARHLDLPPHFFDDTVADGNSVLRLLHYPPVASGAAGVRAEAHEDINAITLLLGAAEPGLQLLDRDGRWIPVPSHEGALVVNVGDMLQRLTNGVLRSTTHRVVNPAEERATRSRYSMPFFLHFRPDYLIDALPGCVSAGRPQAFAPITADDYLQERLREIRLA